MHRIWTSADFTSRSAAMLLAVFLGFLVLTGLLSCAYGIALATSRRRPLDLLGGLLAAVGLALATLGAGRMLSERFFTGL